MKHTILEAEFTVGSDILRADLYMPDPYKNPPVIVMGHGFGGQRKFGLPAFAERFADAGIAVLLFDYRGFGDSGGIPRAFVDAGRHIEDFDAAVNYAGSIPGIDSSRICLWGTSFAGGHVLTIASRRKDIAAVIAQVPHLDGIASSLLYPSVSIPRVMYMALKDILASFAGREPVRIPIISESGPSCLAGSDCYEGYMSLVPEGASWENAVPARIMLTIGAYRPVAEVHKIQAPVFIVAAEKDTLIPLWATRRTARIIRNCRLEIFQAGHFDLYRGDCFERNIQMQTEFLKEKLDMI